MKVFRISKLPDQVGGPGQTGQIIGPFIAFFDRYRKACSFDAIRNQIEVYELEVVKSFMDKNLSSRNVIWLEQGAGSGIRNFDHATFPIIEQTLDQVVFFQGTLNKAHVVAQKRE